MQKLFHGFLLTLGLVFGMAVAETQAWSERIGLLGPPEEPRFSEVRDGLQQGLRDQGYTEQALQLLEARVTRGDQEQVRTAVAGFLQQRAKSVHADVLVQLRAGTLDVRDAQLSCRF